MIYIFNPDHDLAIADFSPNYTPPASILKMKGDLVVLPIWYSDRHKVVADGEQNMHYFEHIKRLLPIKSTLISSDDIINYGGTELVPWGWNPLIRNRLLKIGVSANELPTTEYLEKLRGYSNRLHAVEILKNLREENDKLTGESHYFTNLDDVLKYLNSTTGNKVLKMPVSGSGRGLIWILGEITDKQTDWCRRVIKKQGGVVAEPVFDKVLDFALEFEIQSGNIEFVGYSLFKTASSGAYSGNYLMSDGAIEQRLSSYIPISLLHHVRELVQQNLSSRFFDYNGYVGVDMMICRDTNESVVEYKIHPCVEINLRMNMGIVSQIIYNTFIDPGSEGRYSVEYFKKEASALVFHEKMQREKPLIIEKGKVVSGYLALTPVTPATHYVAFVLCTTNSGDF
ncbi:MAG: hypothetical protein ITF98_05885 [Fermentimonas sp.]|nr:hypothetical protein [Fermentimonas sp.]